jgi:chromosome segregation protein
LVGFKSFADKTQFDFDAGITAIVGPNGSGKSNIVDAVRWILGEQSAKSLRGGEMADVIFNGSTSRRSLGLAEVTMTFDNAKRTLNTESAEVQITRRVYRGGEGEYLINQQVCRLRDIKDLFLGSGAGTDAYSIIEQGRVDVLLQSSTKERRSIFEEAAGISRFKAKKIESQRKLERVDQNLQRLRDIIDEVEKQLRSVKLQAAKAQRYQEYSGRLKELRLALGLEEYQSLSEKLQAEVSVLETLRAGLEEHAAQVSAWETDSSKLEETLQRLDETIRDQEGQLAHAREQIAASETTLGHERAQSGDLENELSATRRQLSELRARVGTLAEAAGQAAVELGTAEADSQAQQAGVQRLEYDLNAAVHRLAELQKQVQADHAAHLDHMRQAGNLHNEAVTCKAQVDNLKRERQRLLQKTEQAAEHLATLDLDLQELARADEELQARLAAAKQALVEQRQERERLQQVQEEMAKLAADLRAQQSGLASRIEVLEGLERSHEGLGTGVREVIALREQREPGGWRNVLGMIADLLTVRREYAPLIDLALGDWSQRFVVRDMEALSQLLQQRSQPFSGRVSFLPLRPATREPMNGEGAPARANRLIEISQLGRVRMPLSAEGTPAHPGVVAGAAQLISCDDAELAELPKQLLGQTLVVRDLAAARAIAAHTTGYRFVTLQGELLEADGTLTVGTHHAETGILSRKSELRELRQQAAELERRLASCERDLIDLRERTTTLDGRLASAQDAIDVLTEQAADLRTRIGQHRQRREGLHEEVTLSRREISGLERDIAEQDEAWQRAQAQAEAADRLVHDLQQRLQQAEVEIRTREHERQQRQHECTRAKVDQAKVEERVTALRAKHQQMVRDLEQRRQERQQAEDRLSGARQRLQESERTMLQATAALARWYLDKEAAERRSAELTAERDLQRKERQLLSERAQTARGAWKTYQEQAHSHELQANDLRHRRDALTDRLREDYQLDLAELYRQQAEGAAPPAAPSADAQEEIEELRRKLSRLGSVNLDSLQELADMEMRASTLQTQYEDLIAAKRSLEEIIGAINQDSRRLFAETFATIRTHFQELFRKLFGGGMADIVLEDENDILETGIEIIARPPGKELRSISLMSGGEKTMTAVALLLAIFRSKPSPFCILDEVDAALDEANIGRYTSVLREFLDLSQFIIITHSKKTMASADVLYGITMQESGVSKRVSVRFEDWPEDEKPPDVTPSNEATSFAGR